MDPASLLLAIGCEVGGWVASRYVASGAGEMLY